MEAFAADRDRVRVVALERNVGPGANLHEAYRRSTKQFTCYATVDRFYDTKGQPWRVSDGRPHRAASAA